MSNNQNQNSQQEIVLNFYLVNNHEDDNNNDNDNNRSNSSSIDFSVLNFSQFNSPIFQPMISTQQSIQLNDFLIEVESNCKSINKTFNMLDEETMRELFSEINLNSVKFEISKNIKTKDCLYDIDGNLILLIENICENRIYCDIIKNLKIRSTQYDNIDHKILFKSEEITLNILPVATTLSEDIKIKINKDDIISEDINIHYVGYILTTELRNKILLNNIEDESGYVYIPAILNI